MLCAPGSGFSISPHPSISSSLATSLPSLVQPSLWEEEEEDGIWLARRGLVVLRLALYSALIPVFLFTPCERGRGKTPKGPEQIRQSGLQWASSRGPYSVWAQNKFLFLGVGLSSSLPLRWQRRCVKLLGDLWHLCAYGSQSSRVQVELTMKSTRNSPDKLFIYIHRVW